MPSRTVRRLLRPLLPAVLLPVTLAAGLMAMPAGGNWLGIRPAAAQAPTAATTTITASPQPDIIARLPARLAEKKEITVAVALGSPPDDFRDEKGNIAGWEIDILHAAADVLGLKLELRPTTFDTLIPGLQAKRFDAAVGQMGISDVRLKVVDMIGTLLGNELFAARGDSPIKVDSLDDLCGRAVATTRGSREVEFANLHQPRCKELGREPINILAFNDGNGAAESLMSRRSDLFWLGSTTVSYFVSQSRGRAKVVGHYTDTSYIGIALPKDSDLSAPLQMAVSHLLADGTYRKIVEKWGLGEGAVREAPLNPTGTPR
ncbi:ABC transporter amino acid-binding protein [Roseomonas mucosa]|uniref:ABC transporter amino acid-binding protein n=1 Tax=Roseomonas mucosa TaxID=207340 RepID=A0A4Y1MSW8_9PROT|nr:ABC transporter substrate-binding protein [Roseomonas mucosa]AWV21018.1 ABC transporter amino acid-binding protein [Roseomonas mucosa]MDT8352803.1 ABC transporter substrate-binding protein [Roseomonas mucosa]MDU7523070.1 ABC transporter substrate-binding protein [Roseomonas mucosa]